MSTPRTDQHSEASPRGLDRRTLLTGGAIGFGLGGLLGAGGAIGLGAGAAAAAPLVDAALSEGTHPSLSGDNADGFGRETLPCHGAHQAGIVTPPGAHMRFIAFQLRPETDRAALERMFRVLTGDIEGLTSGVGPLADPEPELAARPARLTITVGVGPELVRRIDPALMPEWLGPLPVFSRDQLGGGYDDGDMLLMVQADDPLPIAHASRMLHRDLESFAEPLWTQQGFRTSRGAEHSDHTMRNLMGQVDGTVNPAPDEEDFDSLIWLDADAGAFAGGSAFVLRRIRLELDTWDMVDRPGREATIGRRLADGSPLSAPTDTATEHTPADFDAKNALGFGAIATAAHIRRAHSTDPSERIFRRATNYDEAGESGLLFGCYQRNPLHQFVPIQQRLDELDMLNEWVTHTGSAVFAILPGFAPGDYLADTLFA